LAKRRATDFGDLSSDLLGDGESRRLPRENFRSSIAEAVIGFGDPESQVVLQKLF